MKPGTAIAVVFVVGASLSLGVYMHEFTHKYVAEAYGCEAEMHFTPAGKHVASTTWHDCPIENFKKVEKLQEVVEIVGYQLVPVYGILGAVLAFQLVILKRLDYVLQ